MNPNKTTQAIMGMAALFLCLVSFGGNIGVGVAHAAQGTDTVNYVTDMPQPDAFLEIGIIRATTVVSSDGIVREKVEVATKKSAEQGDEEYITQLKESLRDYCQKNRMELALAKLDNAELTGWEDGSITISATRNVIKKAGVLARGNFDSPIVFADHAFFAMKDGCPYIGITDVHALQVTEYRERMLESFDEFAGENGIESYEMDFEERIDELAELEDAAASAPDFSSTLIIYEGDDNREITTQIIGRDQLDPQIYELYLLQVDVKE